MSGPPTVMAPKPQPQPRHRETLLVLLAPAIICLAVAGVAVIFEVRAGGIVAEAGIVYAATATTLCLLVNRRHRLLPHRRPVLRFEVIWVVAWIVGIVSFTFAGALSGLLDGNGTTIGGHPVRLDPLFWLTATPFALIYLVSTPIVSWSIRPNDEDAAQPPRPAR